MNIFQHFVTRRSPQQLLLSGSVLIRNNYNRNIYTTGQHKLLSPCTSTATTTATALYNSKRSFISRLFKSQMTSEHVANNQTMINEDGDEILLELDEFGNLYPHKDFLDSVHSAVLVWGNGSYGQTGTGLGASHPMPVVLDAMTDREIIKISNGATHTISIAVGFEDHNVDDTNKAEAGNLYAWGSDAYNQLGLKETRSEEQYEPIKLSTRRKVEFKDVDAGLYHNLALGRVVLDKRKKRYSTYEVYSWGGGLLGNGTSVYDATINKVSSLRDKNIEGVNAGGYHSVAYSKDALYTWGWLSLSYTNISNEYHHHHQKSSVKNLQEEDEEYEYIPYYKMVNPVRINFFDDKKIVSAGCGVWHTSIAVGAGENEHKIYTYGNEQYDGYEIPYCPFHPLDINDEQCASTKAVRTVNRLIPDSINLPIEVGGRIKMVRAGASFTVILAENGRLFVFGQNPYVCPALIDYHNREFGEYEPKSIHSNRDGTSEPKSLFSGYFSSREESGFGKSVEYASNIDEDEYFVDLLDVGRVVSELHVSHSEEHGIAAEDNKIVKFQHIDCGDNHIMAVTDDGSVYCWGLYEQIETGKKAVKVFAESSKITRVACGLDFTTLY